MHDGIGESSYNEIFGFAEASTGEQEGAEAHVQGCCTATAKADYAQHLSDKLGIGNIFVIYRL